MKSRAVKKFKSHCRLNISLQPAREGRERLINEKRDCDEIEVSSFMIQF